MSGSITDSRLLPRDLLSEADRDRMFALMTEHYTQMDRTGFERDLAEKNWVLLFRDAAGQIQGFSTLLKYHASVAGRPVTVIFSGDTVIDRDHWGSRALPRNWIRAVRSLHTEDDHPEIYWLLLTGGFRTYRFLPLFWREFFPSVHNGNEELRQLRDRLATDRFGATFDPDTGIVRLPGAYAVKNALAAPTPGKRRDPHIDFFLQHNPGHCRGDELACIADLGEHNLTAAGRRMCRP